MYKYDKEKFKELKKSLLDGLVESKVKTIENKIVETVEKKIVKKRKKKNEDFKLFASSEAKIMENYFSKRYGINLKSSEFSPNVYENLAKLYKTKIDKLDFSKGKEHRYERETITKFDRCKMYV